MKLNPKNFALFVLDENLSENGHDEGANGKSNFFLCEDEKSIS